MVTDPPSNHQNIKKLIYRKHKISSKPFDEKWSMYQNKRRNFTIHRRCGGWLSMGRDRRGIRWWSGRANQINIVCHIHTSIPTMLHESRVARCFHPAELCCGSWPLRNAVQEQEEVLVLPIFTPQVQDIQPICQISCFSDVHLLYRLWTTVPIVL